MPGEAAWAGSKHCSPKGVCSAGFPFKNLQTPWTLLWLHHLPSALCTPHLHPQSVPQLEGRASLYKTLIWPCPSPAQNPQQILHTLWTQCPALPPAADYSVYLLVHLSSLWWLCSIQCSLPTLPQSAIQALVQGCCTGCSLRLGHLGDSLTSFRSPLKCYLFRKAFSTNLSEMAASTSAILQPLLLLSLAHLTSIQSFCCKWLWFFA